MIGHTPGPWHIHWGQKYPHIKAASGAYVFEFGHYGVRTKADAHLIAAAPDLLAELKHLVRLIEPVESSQNIPGLATLNGARAAIAKAEAR